MKAKHSSHSKKISRHPRVGIMMKKIRTECASIAHLNNHYQAEFCGWQHLHKCGHQGK